MEYEGLQSVLLAESDAWSELFRLIIIVMFVAVPAIIRGLNERSKAKSKETENLKPREIPPVFGSVKRETTARKPVCPKGPLSQWDRRQQLIRERLAKLKEQAEAAASEIGTSLASEIKKSLEPPRNAQASAETEFMSVAEAIETKPLVPPPALPVQRLPECRPAQIQIPIVKAVQPAAAVHVQPIVKKSKAAAHKKSEKKQSAIERILQKSNPIQAGIILKEILDKPAAYRYGADF
jgi:hypothetical protein